MCQQNAVLSRRPCQELFIVSSRQAGILRSNDVEIAAFAEQRAKNVVVEVLVG